MAHISWKDAFCPILWTKRVSVKLQILLFAHNVHCLLMPKYQKLANALMLQFLFSFPQPQDLLRVLLNFYLQREVVSEEL